VFKTGFVTKKENKPCQKFKKSLGLPFWREDFVSALKETCFEIFVFSLTRFFPQKSIAGFNQKVKTETAFMVLRKGLAYVCVLLKLRTEKNKESALKFHQQKLFPFC
jgi:hypothetical protein